MFHIKACIFNLLLMKHFLVECWCDANQRVEEKQTESLKEMHIICYIIKDKQPESDWHGNNLSINLSMFIFKKI